jgi:hypothetical protein
MVAVAVYFEIRTDAGLREQIGAKGSCVVRRAEFLPSLLPPPLIQLRFWRGSHPRGFQRKVAIISSSVRCAGNEDTFDKPSRWRKGGRSADWARSSQALGCATTNHFGLVGARPHPQSLAVHG